jgi:hypothetical protein
MAVCVIGVTRSICFNWSWREHDTHTYEHIDRHFPWRDTFRAVLLTIWADEIMKAPRENAYPYRVNDLRCLGIWRGSRCVCGEEGFGGNYRR